MWRRGGGLTNAELVAYLKKSRAFTSPKIEETMLTIDRGDFSAIDPYEDAPQQIGCNATISAPHMHAAALQGLEDHLFPGAKVLDVGSGSGYLTACFANMVSPNGKAIGIEHIEQLVEESRENVAKNHRYLLEEGLVEFVTGDGRLGHPIVGGYNAIHVGAAAENIPEALINQLAPGARMLIPVGRELGDQVFLQIDKSDDGKRISQKVVEHVMYVPLTNPQQQLGTGHRGHGLLNY